MPPTPYLSRCESSASAHSFLAMDCPAWWAVPCEPTVRGCAGHGPLTGVTVTIQPVGPSSSVAFTERSSVCGNKDGAIRERRPLGSTNVLRPLEATFSSRTLITVACVFCR